MTVEFSCLLPRNRGSFIKLCGFPCRKNPNPTQLLFLEVFLFLFFLNKRALKVNYRARKPARALSNLSTNVGIRQPHHKLLFTPPRMPTVIRWRSALLLTRELGSPVL